MAMMPYQIEENLRALDNALDDAQNDLVAAEENYQRTKADYELAMAKARIELGRTEHKMTVQDKADHALVMTQALHKNLAVAEAWVRGSRANVNRLRTKVDITRSLGASVRSAMEL